MARGRRLNSLAETLLVIHYIPLEHSRQGDECLLDFHLRNRFRVGAKVAEPIEEFHRREDRIGHHSIEAGDESSQRLGAPLAPELPLA